MNKNEKLMKAARLGNLEEVQRLVRKDRINVNSVKAEVSFLYSSRSLHYSCSWECIVWMDTIDESCETWSFRDGAFLSRRRKSWCSYQKQCKCQYLTQIFMLILRSKFSCIDWCEFLDDCGQTWSCRYL